MDAPKCPLCKERHYGLCTKFSTQRDGTDTAGGGGPSDSLRSGGRPRRSARDDRADDAPAAPVAAIPKTRAPRGTFDRTAYQRELMRKRRERKK